MHFVFAAITIAIYVFLIIESAMDGGNSSAQSQGFTAFLINVIRAIDSNSPLLSDLDVFHAVTRKLFGHFLAFGGAGIFTALSLLMLEKPFRLKTIIIALAMGLSLAFITEGLQLIIPGRAGQFTDVLIDFSGFILFAGLIYLVIYLVFKNIDKKKGQKDVSALG